MSVEARQRFYTAREAADLLEVSLPTREAPVRFKGMPEFVRTLGGGYFFVPGRSLLRYLASSAGSQEIRKAGETGVSEIRS